MNPTPTSTRTLTRIVLRAVALAMGIAVIVINVLGVMPGNGSVLLLGIGLAALALDAFEA
jgi:hypothetical protein